MASIQFKTLQFPSNNNLLDPHHIPSNRFLSIPNPQFKTPSSQRLYSSISLSSSPLFQEFGLINQEDPNIFQEQKESIFTDNLDQWVRESVIEIVKNLKKAPLLVHVYSKKNGELMEVETEEGVSDNWPNLKKKWRGGERKVPDGIILVEELEDNDDEKEEEEKEGETTKAWGVLVQGKGTMRECCSRPCCYLLKTCRVNSGLGIFGTHFSLIKVNSFRESAFSQIKNSWLLQ